MFTNEYWWSDFPVHKELTVTVHSIKLILVFLQQCLEINADKVIFPIHKELAFEQCTFNKTHFSTFTKCLEMNADRVIFFFLFIGNWRFNVYSIKLILVLL